MQYFVDAVLRRCKYSNAPIGLHVQQRFNGVIPYRRALLSFLTRLSMIAGGGHRIGGMRQRGRTSGEECDDVGSAHARTRAFPVLTLGCCDT